MTEQKACTLCGAGGHTAAQCNWNQGAAAFQREERYIVIKRKDLALVPAPYRDLFLKSLGEMQPHIPQREYVVVESDWTEYETVWAMIAARIEGRPTPYQSLEQQIAALRQHKNDYMEAAEGTRKALEAEAQALREEVEAANERADTLEHRMMGMMTRHFAEAWRKRDTEKALDGYLSAGIAELEQERNAALAEVAALRARVVVPERAVRNPHSGKTQAYVVTEHWNEGWNACLDELARLNSKAVSEGLLRNAKEAISEYAEGIKSVRRKIPEADQRLAELGQYIEELGALLGEGKEHE